MQAGRLGTNGFWPELRLSKDEGGIENKMAGYISNLSLYGICRNSSAMRSICLCSAVLLSMLAGCALRETGAEAELRVVVAKYNNALIEAYKNQLFKPLKEVADEEEVQMVNIFISSYLQGNQVMDAELLKMDFKEIKIEGEKATVRTSEEWSYRWIHYKTMREIEPRKNIRYEILYYIVKKDGRWLVKKVEETGSGVTGQGAH